MFGKCRCAGPQPVPQQGKPTERSEHLNSEIRYPKTPIVKARTLKALQPGGARCEILKAVSQSSPRIAPAFSAEAPLPRHPGRLAVRWGLLFRV